MKHVLRITKLAAAENQLKTAIRMVFHNFDPISIHTIACAAHQILYDIAKKRGVASDLKDIVPRRKKRDWINVLNSPYNFFRHADKDIDDSMDFNPETTHFFLLDATYLYQGIRDALFYEGALFRLWFDKHYPEYMLAGQSDDLLPRIVNTFGHFFTDDDFVDYLELIDKYGLTEVPQ